MSEESAIPSTLEAQLEFINTELRKVGLTAIAAPGEYTEYQPALESALVTAGQTLALYDQLLQSVETNVELLKARIEVLDVTGKMVLIQNSGLGVSALNKLRKALEPSKPVGIMLMPPEAEITIEQVDDLIFRLQGISMKKKGITN